MNTDKNLLPQFPTNYADNNAENLLVNVVYYCEYKKYYFNHISGIFDAKKARTPYACSKTT